MLGRIEHVTSGRIARVSSLRGLTSFLADVLRDVTESGAQLVNGDTRKDDTRCPRT